MANESRSKMTKMLFISPLRLFLFSRYLRFFLDFLIMYKDGLIRKVRLISKLMTSQPIKKTIAIHILPNISLRKDNQTIKFGQFGQLIEYNMRNNFS